MPILHIGKKAPKGFKARGDSVHIGHGVYVMTLYRDKAVDYCNDCKFPLSCSADFTCHTKLMAERRKLKRNRR